MNILYLRKIALAVTVSFALGGFTSVLAAAGLIQGDLLPTGKRITSTAVPNSVFQVLNPGLASLPIFLADHAVDEALSPDGNTLLILTSGYNSNYDPATCCPNTVPITIPEGVPNESKDYVFVFDVSGATPVQKQAIQVPNTFNGIAWNPNGNEFYVSGGKDDIVHVYVNNSVDWVEANTGSPIALGHAIYTTLEPTVVQNQMVIETGGVGINSPGLPPIAAGLAVNASGTQLLVANYYNDSVSLIDLITRTKVGELDLRPGIINPNLSGTPGGTYPFAVAFKGDTKAYVSSQRDRELVVLNVNDTTLTVQKRIKTKGQPNKMTLNNNLDRLYVASDNSDTVLIVDTVQDKIVKEISTSPVSKKFKGANPNNVALSPDQTKLFVTNGGTNSVAVIQLHHGNPKGHVIGQIPTGWYPNAVAVSKDNKTLYVVNGKGIPGPNPLACDLNVNLTSNFPTYNLCWGANQYVMQLEKAGFLSLPIPTGSDLAGMTRQVVYNNDPSIKPNPNSWANTRAFLRRKIKHVIYVIKENRGYDQYFGSAPQGDGDPSLAYLAPYAPNHLRIAAQFVQFDNFYDPGEFSGMGWPWSTAARTTDFDEKTGPANIAFKGTTYDFEGQNRNLEASLDLSDRQILHPPTPPSTTPIVPPDMLAGTADVAAPDSRDGEAGTGYLWDGALRAGLTVRNYGFFVTNLPASSVVPDPFAQNIKQVMAKKPSLMSITDEYYRGFDQNNSDFYLFKEWEREFDGYEAAGNLPSLSLVRISHDHTGWWSTAQFGVDTVAKQIADNDYALGRILEKVAQSSYKDSTLVFVVEDDAQWSGDHVDAHRSFAFVAGPYVKQGKLISTHYTTVSLLRTIEEILGIKPMSINDGLTAPMWDIWDKNQATWDYAATVSAQLCATGLLENGESLCPQANEGAAVSRSTRLVAKSEPLPCGVPQRDAAYWNAVLGQQDFSVEDHLDVEAFNRALWVGFKGEGVPYPEKPSGRNLRNYRKALLKTYYRQLARQCGSGKLASAK